MFDSQTGELVRKITQWGLLLLSGCAGVANGGVVVQGIHRPAVSPREQRAPTSLTVIANPERRNNDCDHANNEVRQK